MNNTLSFVCGILKETPAISYHSNWDKVSIADRAKVNHLH